MKPASRSLLMVKALRQLGPRQLLLYGEYRFGLSTGHYQRQLIRSLAALNPLNQGSNLKPRICLPGLPDSDTFLKLPGYNQELIYQTADEIVNGEVRLFGSQPVPLVLNPPEPLKDWAEYERAIGQIDGKDIKFTWEPARFGWAYRLAMAYHLSHNERYAEAFWYYTDLFITLNPPHRGPHWASAQEVALRIIAFGYALQVFIQSERATPERLANLAKAIAVHAERIPTTMAYARAQNNNHLVIEALGLYTASALLPDHPLAGKWHKLGWDWLMYAFQSQIAPDGTYNQHSTNYHRLALQAAIWAIAVHHNCFSNEPIPDQVSTRLEALTRWLWRFVDPDTGRVPNLGHNDGAYILPLTVCPYHDYRPVIYTAAQAILGLKITPEGLWNDMGYWSGLPPESALGAARLDLYHIAPLPAQLVDQPPYVIQNKMSNSWASLTAETFRSRPAHADQLHLDLWWHGANIAQDPGTYLYNSPPPWENSLSSAFVHNTVTIDRCDMMLRAGRFLYLDWAQAKIISSQTDPDTNNGSIIAQHNGYRKIGVMHSRKVTAFPDGHWEICDNLEGRGKAIHTARLHWLLPVWEYEVSELADIPKFLGYKIRVHAPYGWISLVIGVSSPNDQLSLNQSLNLKLAQAGNLLYGSGEISPITGWTSPTYGDKIPALACILEVTQSLPIELISKWILSDEN